MKQKLKYSLLFVLLTFSLGLFSQPAIKTGAQQTAIYIPLLQNQRVALVVNQSSLIDQTHLLDSLLALNIAVKKIFAPEHGFRGQVDRGEHFSNETDPKTSLPIIALFGNNKKPTANQLHNIDVVVFDIQDVGVRFFTYISTMHLVMEACAENNVKMLILDRPNPLGDYVDGPIRKDGFESFVGLHPIPVVHGLTVGELANMINGQAWLKDGLICDVEIIALDNYSHNRPYNLPVKPSPNLPNQLAIRLYPSLCFFEATQVSIGRGTRMPFQVIGYPHAKFGSFSFVPQDIEGMQINPVQEGKTCYGLDLRDQALTHRFTLKYFIDFYNRFSHKDNFWKSKRWFNLLAGNDTLIKQIEAGKSEAEIRLSWQKDLIAYKQMRKKYLLYNEY